MSLVPYFEDARAGIRLFWGDCRTVLPTLPAASVDCVVSDPPYAEVDREYGRLSEAEWFALMKEVVRETRRVLKPQGSAVFIVQPNSERVGKLRPWVFDFQAWLCREWGIVQDAYWWNEATPPSVHCQDRYGLLRPAVKHAVWAGEPDCYRNPAAVLAPLAASTLARYECARRNGENGRSSHPSGQSRDWDTLRSSAERRGGATPPNLLRVANSDASSSGGAFGHGAATPLGVCRWWVRYLCPPGGVTLDPFSGTATVGEAAHVEGRQFIGIEQFDRYLPMAVERCERLKQGALDLSPAPLLLPDLPPIPTALRLEGI